MTSEDYFEAAFRILATRGAEGVTIVNLCEELNVTKGSFYYHFYNMPEFVEAFVHYWEGSFAAMMSAHLAETDHLRQMASMMMSIANLNHEAEAALRAWGHSNPLIEDAQERIGAMGEAMVAAIAANFIEDDDTIALLAHQAISLSIGLQQRKKPIDRVRFLRAIANLAEISFGVKATFWESESGPMVRFEIA
jgi:AcrR family transcriptional regulator